MACLSASAHDTHSVAAATWRACLPQLMTPTREYARQCALAWCRCCTCSRSVSHPTWTKSLSTCWSPPRSDMASATMLCPCCFQREIIENMMSITAAQAWHFANMLRLCCQAEQPANMLCVCCQPEQPAYMCDTPIGWFAMAFCG